MNETQSPSSVTLAAHRPAAAPLVLDLMQVRQEVALPAVQPDEALQNKARDMAQALAGIPLRT